MPLARPHALRAAALAAVGALAVAPIAGAQDLALEAPAGEALSAPVVSAGAPHSCVDALPRTAFRRTMVYLVADHAGEPFAPVPDTGFLAVRLATESIAWQARNLLGAPEGLLPPPDTLVNWKNLGRHLHLVGHRDGRITWSYPSDTPGHRPLRDTVGEAPLALLGRAVDTALARKEFFPWPEGVEGDSIPFLIRFDFPQLDVDGKPEKMRGQHASPLLEVRVPSMSPVLPDRMGRIRYPEEMQRMGVRGTIVMQFVVDTTGIPVDESVRDLWPDRVPRLRGHEARWYAQFVRETKRGLQASRYKPARIGGCAVRQLVQQPFTFDIAR